MSTASEEPKYDLFSPQFFADPHPTFQRMRAEDPVYWHPRLKTWFLVRHDDIQGIARDPRFSAARSDHFGRDAPESSRDKLAVFNRFLRHFLLFNDPPTHTRLRGLISKALAPQVVDGLRAFVEGRVAALLDAVRERGRMDVIAEFARPLPSSVVARLLGIPAEDIGRFKGWTDDLFSLVGASVPTAEIVETGYRGVLGLTEYFSEKIAQRRASPRDDLLSLLIHAEDQGQILHDEEIVATCALLLVAGYETTTNLIANGLRALLQAPDQRQLLHDRPELVGGAVEELLRHDGAAFRLMRRAREDVVIGDSTILSGQVVFGLLLAGNRDPAHFAEPERLDITRTNNHHLALGYGAHFCVGAAIARLEARIAIPALLEGLPDLALVDGPPEWIPSLVVRGLRALPVTFAARTSA